VPLLRLLLGRLVQGSKDRLFVGRSLIELHEHVLRLGVGPHSTHPWQRTDSSLKLAPLGFRPAWDADPDPARQGVDDPRPPGSRIGFSRGRAQALCVSRARRALPRSSLRSAAGLLSLTRARGRRARRLRCSGGSFLGATDGAAGGRGRHVACLQDTRETVDGAATKQFPRARRYGCRGRGSDDARLAIHVVIYAHSLLLSVWIQYPAILGANPRLRSQGVHSYFPGLKQADHVAVRILMMTVCDDLGCAQMRRLLFMIWGLTPRRNRSPRVIAERARPRHR
jgi:hypothetical protein